MARKNKTPVVIYRKDKRLKKTGHLAAFLLTGGTSGVFTAAKAATNAGYNARTRQLQREAEEAEAAEAPAAGRGPKPTFTPEELVEMHAAARRARGTQALSPLESALQAIQGDRELTKQERKVLSRAGFTDEKIAKARLAWRNARQGGQGD